MKRTFALSQHSYITARMGWLIFHIILMTMLMIHTNFAQKITSQIYSYTPTPPSAIDCLTHGTMKSRSREECVVKCQQVYLPLKLAGFRYTSEGSCYCLPIVIILDQQDTIASHAYLVGSADIVPGETIARNHTHGRYRLCPM